ncbi:isoaspartyl peptidase/L-asparaginase [Massilia sp. MP_M2]|uniref:isoaspartyl peptidase/L-asparaginase n=1 Tax=Massilia sp. MP_M2 TaxID=3071713 RepID=UPI00319D8F5D
MEDDGRFNAGSGSVLGLDSATVAMDAAIMDTRGRLGAVACVQSVNNPVRLAHAVADTPHWLLVGEGASRFARTVGMPQALPVSERQRTAHRKLLAQLAGSMPVMPGLDRDLIEHYWNYNSPMRLPEGVACDTVGAVVRGADGHFAVACSSGGSAPALLGRVGDAPIIGSGFFAGPQGAVAATGIGEQIVRHLLARTVYGWIAAGIPLTDALQRGVALFTPDIMIGLIAVSRTDAGAFSNSDMPTSKMVQR